MDAFGEEYWSHTFRTENFDAAEQLISYLGTTYISKDKNTGEAELSFIRAITGDRNEEGKYTLVSFTICHTDEATICTFDGGPAKSVSMSVSTLHGEAGMMQMGGLWLVRDYDSSSVYPAPEPGTYSMLLLSLGIAGVAVRRRRCSIQ